MSVEWFSFSFSKHYGIFFLVDCEKSSKVFFRGAAAALELRTRTKPAPAKKSEESCCPRYDVVTPLNENATTKLSAVQFICHFYLKHFPSLDPKPTAAPRVAPSPL